MASTRRSAPAPKTPPCSSDEYTSSDDEEDSSEQAESSEEDVPSPPPRAKEDSDRDYEESDENSSQSDSGEAPRKPKKNVAKTSLKRKAAAADLAEPPSQPKKPSSSQPKKAGLDAGPSPAPAPTTNPAGAAHPDHGGQAEQLLEEKSAAYDYLWRAVRALEAKLERPGALIQPFLRLADDKASALNTKIKKRRVAEMKLQVARKKIRKEVANALIALIN